jgi:hypothetical protein
VYDADSGTALAVSDAGLSIHEEVTVPAGRNLHIAVLPYAGPWANYSVGITLNPAP